MNKDKRTPIAKNRHIEIFYHSAEIIGDKAKIKVDVKTSLGKHFNLYLFIQLDNPMDQILRITTTEGILWHGKEFYDKLPDAYDLEKAISLIVTKNEKIIEWAKKRFWGK